MSQNFQIKPSLQVSNNHLSVELINNNQSINLISKAQIMKNNNQWLFLGSIFAGLGVTLGAFGAHALEDRLSEDDLSTYETAVRYQMYHAFALLILYTLSQTLQVKKVRMIGWAFVFGIILFSGSLYLLLISGISLLGAITPFGGVSFLLGWFILAKEAYLASKSHQ